MKNKSKFIIKKNKNIINSNKAEESKMFMKTTGI